MWSNVSFTMNIIFTPKSYENSLTNMTKYNILSWMKSFILKLIVLHDNEDRQ